MKKISNIIFAALAVASLASCTKELVEPGAENGKTETRTYVLDLVSTKTNITEAGKTVWCKGDTVVITDGVNVEKIAVPDDSDGEAMAEITTSTITGETVYAIYPQTAIGKTAVTDGKLNVVIPTDQGGDFADANIMVARASNLKFAMKNAASVLKIHVEDGIQQVVFNASGDALSGNLAVAFADDNTISEVTASSTTGIVTLNALGGNADFYVAVAPGTYKAGFNMLALDLDGKFESKSTTQANTLKFNELTDLGSIGAASNLKGFSGEGTEASPYIISNLGEMLAFVNTVNVGNDYSGKFLKVSSDINGVTLPAGYCDGTDDYYFKGNFDGDNHTITVDIDGANCKVVNNVALFGDVAAPAVISNVKVAGKVTTTGDYAAGVIAMINAGSDSVLVTNCSSSATVSGKSYVGGVIGFADAKNTAGVKVTGCSNSGSVTGSSSKVAGITAYSDHTVIDNCSNTGSIEGTTFVGGIVGETYVETINASTNGGSVKGTFTGTLAMYHIVGGYWRFSKLDGTSTATSSANMNVGIGGIAGYGNNTTIKSCTNNGAIEGVSKVAGIIGSIYVGSTSGCVNNGTVTASEDIAGGIQSFVYVQAASTNDTNNGTVSANAVAGGIIGLANYLGYSSSSAGSKVSGATNKGAVKATGSETIYIRDNKYSGYSAAGGIIGLLADNAQNGSRKGILTMDKCSNTGAVTAAGMAAGGIIGMIDHYYTNAVSSTMTYCENSGDVTGSSRIGGIIGTMFNRYLYSSKITVKNVENHGKIASTAESGASSAGGILGWSWYTSSSSAGTNYGAVIYNALNTGDVTYASASAENPYVGGLVGYSTLGIFQNAYNSGKVGPATGTAAEAASKSIGGVAGYCANYQTVNYCYYLKTTASAACGTSSASAVIGTEISAVDANGELVAKADDGSEIGNAVVVFEVDCPTAAKALNAWQDHYKAYDYYTWTDALAFNKTATE